jgi:hypothetical protein
MLGRKPYNCEKELCAWQKNTHGQKIQGNRKSRASRIIHHSHHSFRFLLVLKTIKMLHISASPDSIIGFFVLKINKKSLVFVKLGLKTMQLRVVLFYYAFQKYQNLRHVNFEVEI